MLPGMSAVWLVTADVTVPNIPTPKGPSVVMPLRERVYGGIENCFVQLPVPASVESERKKILAL